MIFLKNSFVVTFLFCLIVSCKVSNKKVVIADEPKLDSKELINSDLKVNGIGFDNKINNSENNLNQQELNKVKREEVAKKQINDVELELPEPIGFVNDFENLLSAEQVIYLENKINEYEKQSLHEIAILTINSIDPFKDIKPFSVAVANKWGVGKKEKNNGVVIVISVNLRKVFIATGLGAEKYLTDHECQVIIDEVITKEFVKGEFYLGIKNGLDMVFKKWN